MAAWFSRKRCCTHRLMPAQVTHPVPLGQILFGSKPADAVLTQILFRCEKGCATPDAYFVRELIGKWELTDLLRDMRNEPPYQSIVPSLIINHPSKRDNDEKTPA